MNEFGVTNRSWSELLSTLEHFPKVEKAILFGSRSRGGYRTGSDIDIALVGDELELKDVHRLAYILNEEAYIIYNVDVLALHLTKNENLKRFIAQEGKVIYTRNSA